MNTARPARRWSEAGGDPARMAEALGEEIDDPAAGLVSRDYLDKRFAEFEAGLTRKIVGLLGVQIVILHQAAAADGLRESTPFDRRRCQR